MQINGFQELQLGSSPNWLSHVNSVLACFRYLSHKLQPQRVSYSGQCARRNWEIGIAKMRLTHTLNVWRTLACNKIRQPFSGRRKRPSIGASEDCATALDGQSGNAWADDVVKNFDNQVHTQYECDTPVERYSVCRRFQRRAHPPLIH